MKFIKFLKDNNIRFEESNDILLVFDKLPDHPMVFYKGVDLSNTPIKELPNNTIIKGTLNISGTSITSIPKNLVSKDIVIPTKGKLPMIIEKDNLISIGIVKYHIKDWDNFFKKRIPFKYYQDLTNEDYDIIERDFNNAKKLLKTWNS